MTSAPQNHRFFRRHRWRLLVSEAETGATNMAVDEALLTRASRVDEGVLRIYRWNQPTLSLGRHQTARQAFDPDKARKHGISLVRRLTGGRALLHWREVTYSVTAPLGPEALSESYASINSLLLDALNELGVPATIAGRAGRLPRPASAPCFELPAAGEILVGGRKLVGSAQFRGEHALLQHGSILIGDDQPLVSELVHRPVGEVAVAATLIDALGREPSFDDVATVLIRGLERHAHPSPQSLDVSELEPDVAKFRARYESDAWTWER